MRLRAWVTIGGVILAAVTLAAVVAVQVALVMPAFAEIERAGAERDLQRVVEAINADLAQLGRLALAYAKWDEAAAYVDGTNPAFAEQYLTATLFCDTDADLALYVRPDGSVPWGGMDTERSGHVTAIDAVPGIDPDDWSALAERRGSACAGLVATAEGPMLATAQPVSLTSGAEPWHGVLVMGRFLSQQALRDLGRRTHVDFALTTSTGAYEGPIVRVDEDRDALVASRLYPNLRSEGGIILSAVTPRDITAAGYRVAHLAAFAVAGALAVALFAALVWLRRGVVSPIERLCQEVRQVRAGAGLSVRVSEASGRGTEELARDINRMLEELHEADLALRQSEARLRATFHNAAVGVALVDTAGLVLEANQRWAAMLGRERAEDLVALDCVQLAHPAERDRLHACLSEVSLGVREHFHSELRCLRPTGDPVWTDIAGSAVYGEGGEVVAVTLVVADIGDRKRAEEELRLLARSDNLTELPNRLSFEERLLIEMRRSARTGAPLSVLLIDVDYFKSFNDSFGHLEGDHCLRRIAAILRGSIRGGVDMAARWGGEEFAVILAETDGSEARVCAERIRASVSDARIERPGQAPDRVTISVGVATQAPGKGADATDLVAAADAALYQAKSDGRNRVIAAPGVPD